MFDAVTWSLQRDVHLSSFKHSASTYSDFAVAAPNKPDWPAMLFYRLGEKKFVSSQPLLTQLNVFNDRQKCTVLLAPGQHDSQDLLPLIGFSNAEKVYI